MSGYLLRGERYEFGDLGDITMGDQIRVERWMRDSDLTDARTWDDLVRIAVEVDELPDLAAQKQHPEFRLSLIIGIWCARRLGGEDIWPADCLDYRFDELDFYGDEADPGKG